jgi:UDP-glucose 4-epimerase
VAPVSPYGVAKAAGEQLASVYGQRGLDVVSLRYFTVFGPRQRPDMAIHRLFMAAGEDAAPFRRRGDGEQRREFTYVADVVAATIAAGLDAGPSLRGTVLDVGGGQAASLNQVIAAIERIAGCPVGVVTDPAPHGDPALTRAHIGPARQALGWWPRIELGSGLEKQWAWHCAESADSAGQATPPVTDAPPPSSLPASPSPSPSPTAGLPATARQVR